MAKNILFTIIMIFILDIYIFFYGQKKYRGYMNLKLYFQTFNMPMYRQVFMIKLVLCIMVYLIYYVIKAVFI